MMPSARVPPWRDVCGKDWRRCHFPAERQGLIEALALLDSPETAKAASPAARQGLPFPADQTTKQDQQDGAGRPRVDLNDDGV